jgi:CheY-like chemotaxis protein
VSMHSCEILVVEDDTDLREMLAEVAASMGHRVLLAANGEEGLAILAKHRPALVLVDLFMPVMGGIEFLRTVRRRAEWEAIPCVLMTGANDSMVGVKEDAVVLYKPLDLDVLADVIMQHCSPDARVTSSK